MYFIAQSSFHRPTYKLLALSLVNLCCCFGGWGGLIKGEPISIVPGVRSDSEYNCELKCPLMLTCVIWFEQNI